MRLAWCGLAIVVVTGAACGGGSGFRPDGGGGSDGGGGGSGNRWTGTLPAGINRNVDILFMIDDSSDMRLAQTNLVTNFPTFMTTLQGDPHGLPNIHIAVVSQDMGAGDGSISGCDATGGKKGIFQYTAHTPCTATNLQQGATYISNIGGQANYTGNVADVFSCIAALGEAGCGFEHQFAAILRALGADGQGAPPVENQGFLRPEAYLTIVMLSNEDDCSAAPGVPLFDTTANQNIASQLGPPANFRCNEFGHTCPTGVIGPTRTVAHPDRNAPNQDVTQMVSYDGCTSNDTEGYLLSVKDTAARLKALKSDPSLVSLVSIAGPATPYTVHWMSPSTADRSCGAASCPWPAIGHSCNASDGSFADPGVREQQLANEFGVNGLVLSICDTSYAPVLQRVGQMINGLLAPPCLPGPISLDPSTGGADCKITMTSGGVGKAVPACAANGGDPPCWQLVQGNCSGGSGYVLQVSPDPSLPATTAATISYSCGKCVAGMPDPTRGCP